MRKLIITRGQPGSGKSHALKAIGMEQWTLSADNIRSTIAAPFLTSEGQMIVNQDVSSRAFMMLNQFAAERMSRGETLAIDSTLIERSNLKHLAEMAKPHRYQIAVLDMSTIPLELTLKQNSERQEINRVPEFKIREMHAKLLEAGIRDDVDDITIISGKEDGSHIAELDAWLREPVHDFSDRYKGVIHIGDLQGCFTVLAGEGGPLANGFDDDYKYVFVGDLLDRGIENGQVMRWFVDNALSRENVTLLWGNHEDHLDRWARGEDAISGEFALRTLPQLLEAGITPADAEAVCQKAKEFLQYNFKGAEVLVTHAGLSTFPDKPHLISLDQYSHGTGYWEDPIDEQFERNSKRGFQVHGHRNHGNVDIAATEHSFNLEDSVEHGGNLRICTLDGNGWSTNAFRNYVYRPLKERLALETQITEVRKAQRKMLPHWIIKPDGKSTELDASLLKSMHEHEGVRQKASERFPHVYSLNFTKKVFYDRSWDDVVVKARGLFVDRETSKIVSRGYDKFFNVGEREETELTNLAKNLRFPIRLYVKYNGFLGNMGYDEKTDSLFVASKSTPDGDFADIFSNIIAQQLTSVQQEKLRRYLRDTESSMTWEVIDPVNDPHMIEYDEPKIVLLDIIHRSSDFEKASFDVVEAVGRKFGLETKKLAMTFQNAAAFAGWYKKATTDMNYRVGGEHVEGLVIEDAAGYMTKVKLPFYAFWKQMRGVKDRIVASRDKGTEFTWSHTRKPDGEQPDDAEIELAHSFRDWCLTQDSDTLKADIITLRKAYEAHLEYSQELSGPSL
ncbi:RNA ligase [Mesorhizobium sp. SP-1A]|uniref:RNA ligase n=1 Tax=Mesorhizobium sp. SP-1A TaxID=3077840 RepID=UPI0028F6CC00|nr:RNA ligase [Mesorhizobium sp. SP-1A]